MPKTLIAYNTFSEDVKFYEVEGDYRHLNDVVVGACAPGTKGLAWDSPECEQLQSAYEKLGDELIKLLLNADGTNRTDRPALSAPTKDWDYFIQCGFAP